MNRSMLLGSALVLQVMILGIAAAAPLPEPTLEDDRKNIQGFWLLPAAGNRDPIILRFHKGHMTVCEFRDDSGLSSMGALYDLRDGEKSRVICRKDGGVDKQFINYRLEGDKLILDDESSAEKMLFAFSLKGEWRRCK